jgi:hypothetical protein
MINMYFNEYVLFCCFFLGFMLALTLLTLFVFVSGVVGAQNK